MHDEREAVLFTTFTLYEAKPQQLDKQNNRKNNNRLDHPKKIKKGNPQQPVNLFVSGKFSRTIDIVIFVLIRLLPPFLNTKYLELANVYKTL